MQWFSRYLQFSTRSWVRETTLRTSTLVILIFTYAVTLFLIESAFNFKKIINRWGNEAKLTVYLSPGQTEETKTQIRASIEKNSEVDHVEYLSQDQAAQEFSKKNSIFSKDFLEDLKTQDVFSESYEVTLKGKINDQSYFDTIIATTKSITGIIGVEEVSYGQGWIEKYSAFIRISNSIITAIVLLFILASVLIISNLIRVLIYNHSEEIEILELIGETKENIRRPFLLEGAVFSGISALIGISLNIAIFSWLSKQLSANSILSHLADVVAIPNVSFVITSLFVGILVGLASAFFTIRSINTGWRLSTRTK